MPNRWQSTTKHSTLNICNVFHSNKVENDMTKIYIAAYLTHGKKELTWNAHLYKKFS